jgi:hypothetical protein
MNLISLRTLVTAAVVLVTSWTSVFAQELTLRVENGLVTLVAADVSIAQVLERWSTITGLKVISMDGKAAELRVSLQLTGVPERQALASLLRDISGYVMGEQRDPQSGIARIDRLMILPQATPGGSRNLVPGVLEVPRLANIGPGERALDDLDPDIPEPPAAPASADASGPGGAGRGGAGSGEAGSVGAGVGAGFGAAFAGVGPTAQGGPILRPRLTDAELLNPSAPGTAQTVPDEEPPATHAPTSIRPEVGTSGAFGATVTTGRPGVVIPAPAGREGQPSQGSAPTQR